MRKNPLRYQPRHSWYLADALLLIRELQQKCWPVGWHVALGGGALNHGYSDGDLDLYFLPIYNNPNEVNENGLMSIIDDVLGDSLEEPICST